MMDAGSMAVFSLACLVLYKLASRFSKAVDKATIEVADFTVVIKGLPETTTIDVSRQPGPVGQHHHHACMGLQLCMRAVSCCPQPQAVS
jgi:hypothetical protein